MKRKSLLFALLLAFALPWAASAQQALPYSYGFEDNDLSADGWTAQVTSNYSGINANAAYEGSYGFRFHYSEQSGYLVSPLLTGTNNGVALSFYYKEYSSDYGDEQFYVGYTTDESNTDPTTFTYGNITTASLSWQLYEITLPANTKRVAIKYVYNNAYYLYLDSFAFEVPSSCKKPTGLAATLTPGNGTVATLSWAENGEATNWVLEYGTASDFTGAISVNVSGTPSQDLSGLTAEQAYYARVKPDCDTNGTKWSATCTFKPTNALTLTVNDGTALNTVIPFDTYSTDTYGSTGEYIIPASTLSSISGNDITGIQLYISVRRAWTATFKVYLKEVDETTLSSTYGPNACTVVWEGTLDGTDNTIDISFDDTYTYNGGNLLVGTYISQAGNYISTSSFTGIEATGAAYASGTYQGQYDGSYNFIPKTTLAYAINLYPKPRNLAFSNLTTQGVTASWTAPNSDVRSYEYQYGAGEEWTSWTSTTATSVELDHLTPDHTYTFRVKAVYADGESEYIEDNFTTLATCPVPTALAANPSSITAHEATLTWTADNDSYNIRYQVVNGVSESFDGSDMPEGWNATTTNWSVVTTNNAGGNPNEIRLYWNPQVQGVTRLITPACDLTGISSVTFSFKHMLDYYDGTYTRILGIATSSDGGTTWNTGWSRSDFSGDVPAETISEVISTPDMGNANVLFCIYFEGDSYGFDHWYFDDIEITIPNDTWQTATSETTTYNFSGLAPETKYTVQVQGVCEGETTAWSEAVSFTTAIACPVPTNLVYNNVTKNSVELSWTEAGDATDWEICVNGDEENLVGANTNENFRLRGLTPDTYYTVKVRAVCGGEDGESQWSNAISFSTPVACPVPVNLNVDEITKNTAVLTWGEAGEASAWQIMLNDDESHLINVTEANAVINEGVITYTLEGLSPQTDYSVTVRANCGGDDGDSQWCNAFGFTTEVACPAPTDLVASNATYNSVELSWTEAGEATEWEICLNGDEENLIGVTENPYTLDRLDAETDYTVKVRAVCGGEDGESQWSNTATFTTPEACPAPTNLTESNVTFTTATLSWEGSSNSYDLQYRPWAQVGEDQIATGVLTTYTYDLSEYNGTGAIAIRHYDVSDMFQLNIDDVVVTDALGEVIYSENFENDGGNLPSNFSYIDLDGDGYVWSIRSNGTDGNGNPYCNGSYCASSASWVSGVGAIYPDNWMIINGIELGGTLTFAARGQDPEWALENFAVYVSVDADNIEVPSIAGTTYSLDNLEPDVPYSWQVIGDCGDLGSSRVTSSMFKTPSNLLVFNKNGNWNEIGNWVDAEGNAVTALPTIDNKVRVDSTAIIPSDVIAIAGKTTLGSEGSITIKDGGQLKQSSATLRVTMEKEITGIGSDNWSDPDCRAGWKFISSPFSGRTLYNEASDWNHVLNLLSGDYDLYAFDPTQTLEWINYKANSTHIAFQSENGNAGLMYGDGYLYASSEDRTLTFVGSVCKSNNYSETKEYEYNDASTDDLNGWKLVGNYFSCNAYLNYVDENGNVLDADFYTLNNAGDGYELSESSIGLPPCTGAFIYVGATGKVQYATEAPVEDRSHGMLNMSLNHGRSTVDQARVRFGNGYNLQHMSFRKNSSKIYIPMDGMDYAVVNAGQVGELPVSFKAENNGTYTLNFGAQEVSFSYLHLIDNMTGNDVDLLKTPSYTFVAQTTDYANRFRLVFATGSSIDGDSFGFVNAMGNLCIFGIEGEATLQVVDVTGRVLSSNQFSGSYESKLNVVPGVYMLRLINGNDVKVQKMIVK